MDDYSDITAEEAAQPGPGLYYANRCKAALAKAAKRAVNGFMSREEFIATATAAFDEEAKEFALLMAGIDEALKPFDEEMAS